MAVLYFRPRPGSSFGEFVGDHGQVVKPESGDLIVVDDLSPESVLRQALADASAGVMAAYAEQWRVSVGCTDAAPDFDPDDWAEKEECSELVRSHFPAPRSEGDAVRMPRPVWKPQPCP